MDPVILSEGPLLLRPPQAKDATRVFEACQDPEMQRWTTVPVPYERWHARSFVEEFAPAGWAAGSPLVWAIVAAEGGDYLGAIDLRLDGTGAGEVGFAVAPWARGRGVATTALRMVCRWGLRDHGLGRIEWLAHVGNESSRRVAEKAGFRPEGTLRAKCVARGRRYDALVAGLLPGDLR